MFVRILGALVAAFSLAGAAQAATVYDNGPAEDGGLEVTQARVANDFQLTSDTLLTGAGVYLGNNVEAGWDGGFQYSIYSVTEGAPGDVLTGGAVTINPVDTGLTGVGGRSIFLFQFDFLTPFLAQANTSYFLGIHARSDFGDNNGIFWVATEDNGTLNSQFQGNGTGDFAAINQEQAFFLTAADAVPEPQAWALMIVGFGAAGAILRRRGAGSLLAA